MKGAGQPRGNLPACTATSEESLCLTQKLHLTEVRVNPNPRCFLRQLLQHPPHQGSFLSDANSLTLCLLNLGCKGKAADIHNTSSAENLGHWWFHPAFPAQMHHSRGRLEQHKWNLRTWMSEFAAPTPPKLFALHEKQPGVLKQILFPCREQKLPRGGNTEELWNYAAVFSWTVNTQWEVPGISDQLHLSWC